MPKILAADQDLYVLECYKKLFSEAGVEVCTAEDATSAISQFGQHKPDIVILDMELAGGGGKGVLERLRNIFMSKVPVLIATTHPAEVLDMSEDPDVYIVKKDFKTPVLLSTVRRVLKLA
ncbi:MAG: response regulator [Elusimicrobia bacterium]|nr:response regulator [Elusimicrobiota bacterium]